MTTKAVHSQTTDNSAAVVGSRSLRVRRVITTRAGGFSTGRYHGLNLSLDVGDNPVTVAHNRERLAEKLHLPLERFVYMEQLQSPHVSVIEATADTRFTAPIPATDAVVTTAPELALVVLTADAVPVLLGDDEAGVIAALHVPFSVFVLDLLPIQWMPCNSWMPIRIACMLFLAPLQLVETCEYRKL